MGIIDGGISIKMIDQDAGWSNLCEQMWSNLAERYRLTFNNTDVTDVIQ